uniref:Tubulin-specific chaperone D n=1 Tax=Timema cristinae TaxID=61476 RepID=A0A7R9GPX4_TIMCR|nr:unnamed protein product [Timema cristinae]
MDTNIPCEVNPDEKILNNIGLVCASNAFREKDEILNMINNLGTVYNDPVKSENSYECFWKVLTIYQEQPKVLDQHLDEILDKLTDYVRSEKFEVKLKSEACKYLYVVMKVRRYKVIVKRLPHEVTDLPLILELLQSPQFGDEDWQARHVLLLWLSIVILLPFPMAHFEGQDMVQDPLVERILALVKKYLMTNNLYNVAAFLASQFVMRSDIKDIHLKLFLDWAREIIIDTETNESQKAYSMSAIASILKHAKREDILPHIGLLTEPKVLSSFQDSTSSLFRKYGMKALQRIGLTFLKPQIPTWRYQRGCRSLMVNMNAAGDLTNSIISNQSPLTNDRKESHIVTEMPNDQEQNDIEVPEEIEDILHNLLTGLNDTDTIIRWSAAKGIGRITERLPQAMANEVVGMVLEVFNSREQFNAWHGGCLALAQLGNRGLLLPSRLKDVVPVILKALLFDEVKCYASVGDHIRDAACYVCWSLARAFDKNVVQPYVKTIASQLLIVAVFDREVHCRRAASAAFQENVGRQGSFPHGIDIVNKADYLAVGVRSNAFLKVSKFVGQFEEYTVPLINHLVEKKVGHWDPELRVLASKALNNLTEYAPQYMAKTVVVQLLEFTSNMDLNIRSGAVRALAEVIYALSVHFKQSNLYLVDALGVDIIKEIEGLYSKFSDRRQFRGMGGDIMKEVCCHLIKNCSQASLPFHGHTIIVSWVRLVEDCLGNELVPVRDAAVSAVNSLFTEYFKSDPPQYPEYFKFDPALGNIAKRYAEKLQSNSQVLRSGYAMALGNLTNFMLINHLQLVISSLTQCTVITPSTAKWTDSRRDALAAIRIVCSAANVCETSPDYLEKLFNCFLTALQDYTITTRGDVGALVRMEAVTCLHFLTVEVALKAPSFLEPLLVQRIIGNIIQQAGDKIDRVRAHAGLILAKLIHNEPKIPHIPFHGWIEKVFPNKDCKEINWNGIAETFPRLIQLLLCPPYTDHLLLGFILNIGGITETNVKVASSCFFEYLRISCTPLNQDIIASRILHTFQSYQHNDRVTQPMINFLDHLLSSGCFVPFKENLGSNFPTELFKLLKVESRKCQEMNKLMALVRVYCHYIPLSMYPEVSGSALTELSRYLCHRFLFVRKNAATNMYETLLMYGDQSLIPENNLSEVLAILGDTEWDKEVGILRPIRNRLCQMMGVPPPVVAKTNT